MYTCHGSRGKKELGTADTTSVSSSCLPMIHPCAEEFGASGTQVPSSAGVRDRVLEGVYGIRRLLIEEVQQESHAYRGGRGFLGLVDDEPLAVGRERQVLAAGREERPVVPYALLVQTKESPRAV